MFLQDFIAKNRTIVGFGAGAVSRKTPIYFIRAFHLSEVFMFNTNNFRVDTKAVIGQGVDRAEEEDEDEEDEDEEDEEDEDEEDEEEKEQKKTMQTTPLVLALENSYALHAQDCCSQPNPNEAFSSLKCQMSKWRPYFREVFELLTRAEGGLTNEVAVKKLGLMMQDCWRSEEDLEPSDDFCELLATVPHQQVRKWCQQKVWF